MMNRLTSNEQLRAYKQHLLERKDMNDFEKVSRVEMALRTIAAETRKAGGPDNVKASGAINEFLQRAGMDAKLRLANLILANLILENPAATRDEAIVQLRQPK